MKKLIFAALLFLSSGLAAQSVDPAKGRDCDEPMFPAFNRKSRYYGYVGISGEYVVPPSFIKAYMFEGKYAMVMQGSKYGFINCEGTIVTQAAYDDVKQFYYGRGWGLQNGKWGLFDVPGKNVIPPTFDDIKPVHPRRPLVWFKRNGKWGLFDRDVVRYVFTEKYDAVAIQGDSIAVVRKQNLFSIYDYSEAKEVLDSISLVQNLSKNYFAVYRKGKWGVISEHGRSLAPPQYDSIRYVGNVFLVEENKHFGVIANYGRVLLKTEQDELGQWNEGFIPYRKGNLWGFASGLLKEKVEPQFSKAGIVKDSVSIVQSTSGKYMLWHVGRRREIALASGYNYFYRNPSATLLAAVDKGQHYVINKDGQKLTAFAADSIYLQDSATYIRISYKNAFRLCNKNTLSLIAGKSWKYMAPSWKGYTPVRDSLGYTWLQNGVEVANSTRYDSIQFIQAGTGVFVRVWIGNKCGLCHANGNTILPAAFSQLYIESQTIKAEKSGKWGLYSIKGEELAGHNFTSMTLASANNPAFPAIVQDGSRFSLLSSTGKTLGESYNELKYVGNGMFAAITKKKALLVKGDGIAVKMNAVEAFGTFGEGLIAAQENSKWGFMGAAGVFVIKPQYDEALPFIGKTTFVKLNGNWGSINQQGKVLSPFQFSKYEVIAGRRILVP